MFPVCYGMIQCQKCTRKGTAIILLVEDTGNYANKSQPNSEFPPIHVNIRPFSNPRPQVRVNSEVSALAARVFIFPV